MTVHTLFEDGWNVLVKGLDTGDIKLKQEEGWYAPYDYVEEKRPAFAFCKKKETDQSVVFINLVVPYEGKSAPIVDIKLISEPDLTGTDLPGNYLKNLEIEVTFNGEKTKITHECWNF